MPDITMSPVPTIRREEKKPLLSFYEALKAVAEGKRITRVDWQDASLFGFLGTYKEDHKVLFIRTDDHKDHTWLIAQADMIAEDWFVLD